MNKAINNRLDSLDFTIGSRSMPSYVIKQYPEKPGHWIGVSDNKTYTDAELPELERIYNLIQINYIDDWRP